MVRFGIGAGGGSLVGGWRASSARAASKVTVGYIKAGFTCEGSLFAARVQGYFRDEGLELTTIPLADPPAIASEMMKGHVEAMQDPAWTLVQPLLSSGVNPGDMVATAGLQRGSMSIVVGAASSIRTVADLRGLKVSAGGRWRFMFAEPFRAAGLDSQKEINWQSPLPAAQVANALRTQRVAAAAVHQPDAATLESAGEGRILIAQNTPPLQNDYCCSVIVPGAMIRADRHKAAAITRALMRGSAWIRAHPSEAAQLMVDVEHVTANLADNQRAMTTLDFAPTVEVARRNTLAIVQRFQRLALLDQALDEQAVLERIFVPVTGEL
jgi:NitT/TauT family transport system substrate-binding protein